MSVGLSLLWDGKGELLLVENPVILVMSEPWTWMEILLVSYLYSSSGCQSTVCGPHGTHKQRNCAHQTRENTLCYRDPKVDSSYAFKIIHVQGQRTEEKKFPSHVQNHLLFLQPWSLSLDQAWGLLLSPKLGESSFFPRRILGSLMCRDSWQGHSLSSCTEVPASWSEYTLEINPLLFEKFAFQISEVTCSEFKSHCNDDNDDDKSFV